GQVRHVLTSGRLEGEVISGVIMDIGQRKQLEQTLKDNEEKYRTIVDNTENLIIRVDKEGRFLFVNPAGQRILGLKLKDCIGKSAFDFVHPDDKQATMDAFQKWLGSEQEAFYFENRQVSVKGAITQMSWIIKALRDEKKNVIGFLSVAHDITRRKKTEEQLRKSYESVEQILEHSPTGTFIISQDKHIRYANRAALKLTGFNNKEELIGQICHKVICPAEVGKCPVLDLGQKVAMSEKILLGQGGKTIPILKSVRLVNINGEDVVIEKFMDITERKQAEEKIVASEKKYRDLFDNANDLIQIVSPDGAMLYTNKIWRQTLGYTEAKADKVSMFDIVQPDSRKECRELFQRVLTGENVGRFETRFVSKDGQIVVLEGDCNCRFENGRPVDIRGIFRDITERQRADEALTASELRYRRLFEAAKDGILILDFQTGRIVDVNPFLVDLLGFSHEKFLGKELWQVGFFKDTVSNKENFKELQRQKYIRYENLPLKTSQGKQINVEFVSNVYTVNGSKVIQCNIRDITERKLTENKLKDSDARFKTFFENAPIGMAVLNLDGSYDRVNESFCATLGYTPDELYKTSFDKLTHPDDVGVSRETIDLLLKNKITSRNFNKRYFHKNGFMVWAEMNTSLLRDQAGKPLYFIIQAKDITAGIEAEQSLKMQSELLDNSTDSIVLHDD
ncbi:MAG TPA: PAS domain S-box protein, partial [Planctomycetota bacterium]|nr:PAS domain S-box protein [Planctomycetota bacterium]